MEELESAKAKVIGSYYGEGGTLLTIEEVDQTIDSMNWEGGIRIVDNANMEIWNANDLWPAAPGVFVVRTSDMTVVASEADGTKLDLLSVANGIADGTY